MSLIHTSAILNLATWYKSGQLNLVQFKAVKKTTWYKSRQLKKTNQTKPIKKEESNKSRQLKTTT